jgi:hypothetical protein
MNYYIAYLYQTTNGLTLIPYGPAFASEAAAWAWIAAQTNPAQYQVVPAWNPTPVSPGGPLTPLTIPVGQYTVAFIGVNFSGVFVAALYGSYATAALAQAAMAQYLPPQSYSVVQVVAVPGV